MDLARARRQARRPSRSRVRDADYFAFDGGLNQEDPPLRVSPGQLLSCQNYEIGIRGGYERIDGFERFDGGQSPTDSAAYALLTYKHGSSHPSYRDTIDGVTSGASGLALAVTPDLSYGDSEVYDDTSPATNLFNYSEDLSNWNAQNVTINADAINGPFDAYTFGKRKADAIVEDVTTSSFHQISKTFAATVTDVVRVSMYAKAGTRTQALLRLSAPGRPDVRLTLNLSQGSVGSKVLDDPGASVWVHAVGDGWHRYTLQTTARVTGTHTMKVRLAVNGSGGYDGDGVSYAYFSGLQADVNGLGMQGGSYAFTDGAPRSNYQGTLAVTDLPSRGIDYVDGEVLEISAVPFGVMVGDEVANGEEGATHAQYLLASANEFRDAITAVPGTGPVCGVKMYHDNVYAFRESGGNMVMHVSDAAGWQVVPINRKLRFDAGATEFVEGETVTGAGGATATVERVVLQSGAWNGTAEGYLILGLDLSGTFVDNEAITSASGAADANGADVAQTMATGGRFEFRVENFEGHTKSESLYGVDGANYAFEFSDSGAGGASVFTQIETGMVIDTPTHLAVHNDVLHLSFPGGSSQNSGIGRPLEWTVVTGANELALGEEITGYIEEIGQQMFIFGRNRTKVLSGTSVADYQLDDYSVETGGYEYTMQRIGMGLVLDDRGFTSLAATDKYGNYAANSVSTQIQKLVNALKGNAVASVTNMNRNVYRCFFDNGQFLSIGVRGTKISGITYCSYGKEVTCISGGEDAAGNARIFFGSSDGYVYETDKGTSFDGGEIEAYCRMPFHFSRAPSRVKRYRKAQVDVSANSRATIRMTADWSFAAPAAGFQPIKNVEFEGGGALWGVGNWEQFVWGAGIEANATMKLEGSGTNIGMTFYHSSATELSHKLSGVTFQLSYRRIDRNTAG